MSIKCPRCQSNHVISLDHAKRAGGLIGAVGGAASALSGARIGGTVGAIAGPPGLMLGSLAGAAFGVLACAASGGLVGAKVGAIVDERVLDNYQCQDCGHTFSQSTD